MGNPLTAAAGHATAGTTAARMAPHWHWTDMVMVLVAMVIVASFI